MRSLADAESKSKFLIHFRKLLKFRKHNSARETSHKTSLFVLLYFVFFFFFFAVMELSLCRKYCYSDSDSFLRHSAAFLTFVNYHRFCFSEFCSGWQKQYEYDSWWFVYTKSNGSRTNPSPTLQLKSSIGNHFWNRCTDSLQSVLMTEPVAEVND